MDPLIAFFNHMQGDQPLCAGGLNPPEPPDKYSPASFSADSRLSTSVTRSLFHGSLKTCTCFTDLSHH